MSSISCEMVRRQCGLISMTFGVIMFMLDYYSLSLQIYFILSKKMVKTDHIKLMTWTRKTYSVFPYGSSIIPFILTIIVFQTPTICITLDIYNKQYYPTICIPLEIILQLLSIVSLICCVYTNPGIMPQIVDRYQWESELKAIPSLNHNNLSQHKYLIQQSGLYIQQKYCVECSIYRPIRTIHCQVCNHCVQKYDHHCPWLGVCIGKFNYKFFVLFILSVNLLGITTFSISLSIIIQFLMAGLPISTLILEIIVCCAAFFLTILVLNLLFYHFKLISQGLTTNEQLKKIYNIIDNRIPFDKCYAIKRPYFFSKESTLSLNIEDSSERSSQGANKQDLTKGKRYSTLISDRQSVLNYLVEGEL